MTAPLCTCPDRGESDWNGHHDDECPWLVWGQSQQSGEAAQLRKERDAARWADETRRKACEALIKDRDAALANLRPMADQLESARARIAELETAPSTASDLTACEEQRDVYRDRAQHLANRVTDLTTALRSLIARVRRTGGYASPEEQAVLWEAERVLGER